MPDDAEQAVREFFSAIDKKAAARAKSASMLEEQQSRFLSEFAVAKARIILPTFEEYRQHGAESIVVNDGDDYATLTISRAESSGHLEFRADPNRQEVAVRRPEIREGLATRRLVYASSHVGLERITEETVAGAVRELFYVLRH